MPWIQDIEEFIAQIKVDRNPYSNPHGHEQVPIKICNRWTDLGLEPRIIELDYSGTIGHNLVIEPANPDDEFTLVMAHHDTIPFSVGLDDNISGMAIVDILAKELATDNLNNTNVMLLMQDFSEGHPKIWEERDKWEEQHEKLVPRTKNYFEFQKAFVEKYGGITPFFGIRSCIEGLKQTGMLKRLKMVLNLDCVGYFGQQQQIKHMKPLAPDGNYLLAAGNRGTERILSKLSNEKFTTYSLRPLEFIIDLRRSDHMLFWDLNIPTVYVTDTGKFRNPNFHSPNDNEIDVVRMVECIQELYSALFHSK